MSRFTPFIATAIFAVACISALGQATPPKRDPKVQAVLDQSLAAYRALNGLRVKVSVNSTGNAEMLRGAPDSIELRYQKPNKLYSSFVTKDSAGKPLRRVNVSDGTNLWTWSSDTNTYTKTKAPAALKGAPIPNDVPEHDLLFGDKDPFNDLPASSAVTLGGTDKIGDVDVDVLKATASEQGVAFTLAIQIMFGQKDHLIHAMTFEGSGKDPAGKDYKFDLRMTYDVLDINPTFAPGDFAFTPPPGSKPASTKPVAKPASPKK